MNILYFASVDFYQKPNPSFHLMHSMIADLLENVESRYLLVNLVAHRARQIAAEAEMNQEDLPEKPVTMAIEEVADGELSGYVKDEYKN